MKIAIISDIHEDIVSLKKAMKMIEREKCDHIICLGDILGYPFMRAKYESTRNASACIAMVKSYCNVVLSGNHDIFHLKKIPQYLSGFKFPNNWYDLSPEEKIEYAKNKVWNYSDDYPIALTLKEIEYLSSLPEYVLKDFDEKKVLFSHFFYPNFTGYVSTFHGDEKKIQEHFSFMNTHSCELSICGHMHIEGLGICYEKHDNILSRLFSGFMYYSFGEKKIKPNLASITIPALADNGQVNGFAIFDTNAYSINAISLNTNRRFVL